jgi:hypothetical protein
MNKPLTDELLDELESKLTELLTAELDHFELIPIDEFSNEFIMSHDTDYRCKEE